MSENKTNKKSNEELKKSAPKTDTDNSTIQTKAETIKVTNVKKVDTTNDDTKKKAEPKVSKKVDDTKPKKVSVNELLKTEKSPKKDNNKVINDVSTIKNGESQKKIEESAPEKEVEVKKEEKVLNTLKEEVGSTTSPIDKTNKNESKVDDGAKNTTITDEIKKEDSPSPNVSETDKPQVTKVDVISEENKNPEIKAENSNEQYSSGEFSVHNCFENSDDDKISKKDLKPIKNISYKQCISSILFSIFALVICLVIPVTFGNTGLTMTLNAIPIIGDGSISNAQASSAEGIVALLSLGAGMSDTISSLLNVSTILYFAILAVNVLFALFLIISRLDSLRVIFKIYSILAGFAMIFIFLMSLVHVVGFAGLIIQGLIELDAIMTEIETSAILTALGMAIMSAILIKKQFRWFERLY